MSQGLNDYLDQGATDDIVDAVRRALKSKLTEYRVDFDSAEITGIRIVLSDDGDAQDMAEKVWCLDYDASWRPIWKLC